MSGRAAAAFLFTVAATLALAAISRRISAEESALYPLTVTARVYDRKQLLTSASQANETRKGRALWLQRCAFCHDGVGQPTYRTMGSWLGAETVQTLGADALRVIIATGTEQMPGFRYTLQPQQVNQLIAFLRTVPSDQKPTPEQLASRSSGASAAAAGE